VQLGLERASSWNLKRKGKQENGENGYKEIYKKKLESGRVYPASQGKKLKREN
jgi:hypothetical protein